MVRRDAARTAAVVAPVAIFLIVYSIYWPPDVPLIGPDAESYLNFSPMRSGGYPFFLAIVKRIFSDTSHYVIAQYVLYALSVLLFAWRLLRAERSLFFCVIVEVALLANWEVNRYHFSIITETLFLSIAVSFLAAALEHLRTGSARSLAAAAAAAGASLTVRLTGVAFIAALPILLAAAPKGRSLWRRSIVAVLPVVILLGAESLYYKAYHPGPRETLLATQLIGKAAMINIAHPDDLIDAAPPSQKPVQEALEHQFAPVRALVADAPSLAGRCRLEVWYEIFAELEFERAADPVGGRDALTNVALARLRAGVPDYLRLTADHWYCMWTVWATDNGEKAALAAYLEAHKPLPFAETVMPYFEKARVPPFSRMVRAGMLAAAAILALAGFLLIAGLCLRRPLSLELTLGGICGIIVHVGMIVSALGSVGIPRYTIGLWPPLVVGVLFVGAWAVQRVRGSAGRGARTMSSTIRSAPTAPALQARK